MNIRISTLYLSAVLTLLSAHYGCAAEKGGEARGGPQGGRAEARSAPRQAPARVENHAAPAKVENRARVENRAVNRINRTPSLSRSVPNAPVLNRQTNLQHRTQQNFVSNPSLSRERINQVIQQRPQGQNNEAARNLAVKKFNTNRNQNQFRNPNASHIREQVRASDRNKNWFNSGFYDHHQYRPPYYNSHVNWWRRTGWNSIAGWLPWGYNTPIYYADGYPVDLTPDNYNYMQQYQLPDDDAQEAVSGDWLPLGVFAVVTDLEQTVEPSKFIQLALNRNGDISGTYYNEETDQARPLAGYVDQQTQEVLFNLSDVQGAPVATTGLYNLTQAQTSIQVTFANGQVQTRYLIRM